MAYERNDGRDYRDYRGPDARGRGQDGGPDDRGFFERAGDEVRSWFGDEEAERRRRQDERYDERSDRGGAGYDRDTRYGGERYGSDRNPGSQGFGGRTTYGDRDYRGGRDENRDRGGYRPEPGQYARYQPGGYSAPTEYPSWARSNRDEGGRGGGYGGGNRYDPVSGRNDGGRQFTDDFSSEDRTRSSAGGYGSREAYRGGSGQDQDNGRYRGQDSYGSGHREAGRYGAGRSGSDRYGYDRDRRPSGDDDHGHYHDWRSQQIESFDRDYDEYRRENRSRFESEFATWRQTRQGQRDTLAKVKEHQEVVGSDGQHVGTVDHVRGDHLLLTKNDRDAGGHHHAIPGSWVQSVDDKVTLSKSAADAKREWREAEERGGLFGGDRDTGGSATRTGAAMSAGTASTGSTGGSAFGGLGSGTTSGSADRVTTTGNASGDTTTGQDGSGTR
jgi:hypothetical protein